MTQETESRLYLPTRSVSVPTRRLQTFQPTYSEQLAQQVQAVTREGFRVVVELNSADSSGPSELVQVSELHKRSFEFRRLGQEIVIVIDEFGNRYDLSAITLKSVNVTNPRIFKHEPYNSVDFPFLIYGLQESSAAIRAASACNACRQAKVDTDNLLEIVQPEVLPYEGRFISQSELKAILLQQVWDTNAREGDRDPITGKLVPTRQDIPAIAHYLSDENMTFVFYLRIQQVTERFLDFSFVQTKAEFNAILARAFAFINAEEEYFAEKNAHYIPRHFNVENEKDVISYFAAYFPSRLGGNIGKMHKAGLRHGMIFSGNYSTIGSINDHESMTGPSLGLGDAQPTEGEYTNELDAVLFGGHNIPEFPGLIKIYESLIGEGFITGELLPYIAEGNVYKAYFRERGFYTNIIPHLFEIFEQFHLFESDAHMNQAKFYKDLIANQIELPTLLDRTMEDWIGAYVKYESSLTVVEVEAAVEALHRNEIGPMLDFILKKEEYTPESANVRFINFVNKTLEQIFAVKIPSQLTMIDESDRALYSRIIERICCMEAHILTQIYAFDDKVAGSKLFEQEIERLHKAIRAQYTS